MTVQYAKKFTFSLWSYTKGRSDNRNDIQIKIKDWKYLEATKTQICEMILRSLQQLALNAMVLYLTANNPPAADKIYWKRRPYVIMHLNANIPLYTNE
jgi:hypothetical protein